MTKERAVPDGLFGVADLGDLQAKRERVLMSLNPEYYELIWQGLKRHEFRRRYLADRPTSWFVYLTAPVSKLAAVIELDTAIVDTPHRIADIAEQARVGNGESVYAYLKDLERGFAIPIKQLREYPTNTGANFALSREVLAGAGLRPLSAMVICKPCMQRRAFATAAKVWPELDVVCASEPLSLADYVTSIGDDRLVIDMLVGDLQRVIEYPKQGFAVEQEVPPDVEHAYA